MNDTDVLHIIERKSSIPQNNEIFDDISKAYDRAAEIIREHIRNQTGETGFYLENDPEEALEAIELEKNGPLKNMSVYLHGICACFALALNRALNYELLYFTDSEEPPTPNNAVHVFCKHNDSFVDVRGITTDITACLSPFEDFFTEPVIIETTAQEIQQETESVMGKSDMEKYIKLAEAFIRKHIGFYITN